MGPQKLDIKPRGTKLKLPRKKNPSKKLVDSTSHTWDEDLLSLYGNNRIASER